jgi:hypothetical protein
MSTEDSSCSAEMNQRRDELRHFVRRIAVVDDGFLQTLEACGRVCGDVFDFQVTQHLHHQVRSRALGRAHDGRRTDVTDIAVGGLRRLPGQCLSS